MLVTEIIDDKGFNLLHHIVLKSKEDKLKPLFEYARKE